MYREILETLVGWKEKKDRKVLLLAGAKGTGKSYILRDFGEGCFDGLAVIDLKKQEYIRVFFDEGLNRERLIGILEMSGAENLNPNTSLLVIENIDCVSNVAEAVRFLAEDMREYHVAVTLSVREDKFLKANRHVKRYVDIMRMYPLSFKEFLEILQEEELCTKIENNSHVPISDEDKDKLAEYIRLYMYIGGMPSVVQCYLDTGSPEEAGLEKKRLLEELTSRFDEIEAKPLRQKTDLVWNSIPAQLEKENKKFQFGVVKLTARAREYMDAVDWLYDEKYLDKVYRAKEPKSSLTENMDDKSFEVYVADVGLLAELYGLSYEEIANEKDLGQLKSGALVEQYVYQELTANKNIKEIYYWISEATARIEFMFEDSGEVIPVEINLTGNAKAQSIKVYKARYNPAVCISISENVMSMEEGSMKLPLYAIWNL